MVATRPRPENSVPNDGRASSLIRFLGCTSRAMRLHLEDSVAEVPGGMSTWSVLRFLHGAGPTTQAGIAKGVCLADSTLTRRLDSMEDGGLVTRTVDPEDKRRTIVVLSERGETLYGVQRGRADAATASFVKGISPSSLETFAQVVDGIDANLLAIDRGPVVHGRSRRGHSKGTWNLNELRDDQRTDT